MYSSPISGYIEKQLSLVPMVAYAENDQKVYSVALDPCGVDDETKGKVQVQIGDGQPWFAGAWDE